MNLPKAKSENIVVNTLIDEVLIYDLSTNQAVCLNSTSANVFNACDGRMTLDELKAKHNYTDDIVYLALDGLKKENLLEDDYVSPFTGMNRREVIRKAGLASIVALPVISAIIAPTAVMAASNSSVNCVPLNQCRAAGTVICPTGCTGTYDFISYGTANGTCGTAPQAVSVNCTANQGIQVLADYRRIS